MAISRGEKSSYVVTSDYGIPRGPRSASGPVDRGVIHQAAELLRARHHVREISAYELLVAEAVKSHRNVRDTAYSIVEESRPGSTLR